MATRFGIQRIIRPPKKISYSNFKSKSSYKIAELQIFTSKMMGSPWNNERIFNIKIGVTMRAGIRFGTKGSGFKENGMVHGPWGKESDMFLSHDVFRPCALRYAIYPSPCT